MKIPELIELLKKYPPNTDIVVAQNIYMIDDKGRMLNDVERIEYYDIILDDGFMPSNTLSIHPIGELISG